jgi:purine-binding chemotaxis protein CheW
MDFALYFINALLLRQIDTFISKGDASNKKLTGRIAVAGMACTASRVVYTPNFKREVPMADAGIMETTQYLSFKLGEEVFALEIGKVREVLDFTAVTKVPRTPEFIRGVTNVRGSVVPVVDLRLKFGMAKTNKTVNTCLIIAEVTVDEETSVLGALADSVQEVMDLDPGQIEPAPTIGTRLNTEFIKGIGRHNERFVIILDFDKVFSSDEYARAKHFTADTLPDAADERWIASSE